jgi:guanylate kinase
MSKGILVIVSGFSGAGKGTVMKYLTGKYQDYALSISATTRKPREGEVDGKEYFFLTTEEFEDRIARDALIEYAKYNGNYYGTPRDYVEEKLDAGQDVILEIEVQGAMAVKERYPDALLLFIAPPSAAELERRLKARGSETSETLKGRLAVANEEAKQISAYDYLLINNKVEECADEIHQIIQKEHCLVSNRGEFIRQITEELKVFL